MVMCCEELTQVWHVQTVSISEKGLALAWHVGGNLWSHGTPCRLRVRLFTRSLGQPQTQFVLMMWSMVGALGTWHPFDLWWHWTLRSATQWLAIPTRLIPNKNPGYQGSSALPWLVTLLECCRTLFWGKLGTAHMTPLEGDNWKLALVSPGPFPRCLFPVVLICTLPLKYAITVSVTAFLNWVLANHWARFRNL